jgi:hypothetical protein
MKGGTPMLNKVMLIAYAGADNEMKFTGAKLYRAMGICALEELSI